jgi:trk system potassium uptake protein TrkH
MLIAALNFARTFSPYGAAACPCIGPIRSTMGGRADTRELRARGLHVWLQGTYESYLTALRHVSFNLVSLATDCGFASVDYNTWPAFAPFWMLFLSCVTVSSGSTGGGIKMFRSLILVKQAQRQTLISIHPNAIAPLRVGGRALPDSLIESVLAFIFVYFMTVTALTFALLASGLSLVTAVSAVIACINNAGPGLNEIGPPRTTRGSRTSKWVCALAMLAGRIEIFTLLVLFTPTFWRK